MLQLFQRTDLDDKSNPVFTSNLAKLNELKKTWPALSIKYAVTRIVVNAKDLLQEFGRNVDDVNTSSDASNNMNQQSKNNTSFEPIRIEHCTDNKWFHKITAYCRGRDLPYTSHRLRRDEPICNFFLDLFRCNQVDEVYPWYDESVLYFHDVAIEVIGGIILTNKESKVLTCQVNALCAVHVVAIALYGLLGQELHGEDEAMDSNICAALEIVAHRIPGKNYEFDNNANAVREEVVRYVNADKKGVDRAQFTAIFKSEIMKRLKMDPADFERLICGDIQRRK